PDIGRYRLKRSPRNKRYEMVCVRADIAKNQGRSAALRLQPPALICVGSKLDGRREAAREILDLDQTDGADRTCKTSGAHLTHHRVTGVGVCDRNRTASRNDKLAQRFGLIERIA